MSQFGILVSSIKKLLGLESQRHLKIGGLSSAFLGFGVFGCLLWRCLVLVRYVCAMYVPLPAVTANCLSQVEGQRVAAQPELVARAHRAKSNCSVQSS